MVVVVVVVVVVVIKKYVYLNRMERESGSPVLFPYYTVCRTNSSETDLFCRMCWRMNK